MKFRSLQENLRKALWERIEQGELTGLKLAAQTGFRQAHISNFLNRKRSLSLEGMDRVLSAQRLSILDLLDPAEVNKRATITPPSNDEFENVFVVDGCTAANQRLVMSMNVAEIHKFKRGFLRKLRPDIRGGRDDWERFVAIKLGADDGMSMYPRLMPGATVLVDRHYNSLQPYRKGELNMYAVRTKDSCQVRYVELAGKNLILRPHNQVYAVQVITIPEGEAPSDYIVGRICHIAVET
jgi:hypothetical protein